MKEQKIQLKTEDGQDFDIPEAGSLGLLALGYVGLMLWREKRNQVNQEKQKAITQNDE